MTGPAVTVLLPVFNGERYLRTAIGSILSQTFSDFELLVVDDGSADRSATVAASTGDARVRVVANERNLGLARTLNRGLQEAQGTWIARQDADDLSHPQRLERQMSYLAQHPDVVLLGTQARMVDDRGRLVRAVERPCEPASIRWWQMFDNSFLHTSVVFHRQAVLDLGGYDASLGRSQDYELWSRLVRTHPTANLPDALVSYRAHPASVTATATGMDAVQRQAIIRANAEAALGEGVLGPDEPALMLAFRFGVPPRDCARFLALLERLLRPYLQRYPEAVGSLDFWRALARQYALLLPPVLRARNGQLLRRYFKQLQVSPWLPALVGRDVVTRTVGQAQRRLAARRGR
jgi:glycosyltransferase involved in cell wall biosynthesis